ncbi:MAG: dTDP-4-dehydrorhamnose 3,5-epimerase [Candidatus Ranarchaeia archaeon]
MPFSYRSLAIPEVLLITPKVFGDDRGFFMETFKEPDFNAMGINYHFPQDNHSKSKKGVIRGLHYQLKPKAQGKLVRVVRGSLFDVAVDIRIGSPTYGRWVGEILSEANRNMLWIPPGFAHGIAIIEDDTELLYKATDVYSPEHDRSIKWDDPDIGVKWPFKQPILSEKDKHAPLLRDADNNFYYEK